MGSPWGCNAEKNEHGILDDDNRLNCVDDNLGMELARQAEQQ